MKVTWCPRAVKSCSWALALASLNTGGASSAQGKVGVVSNELPALLPQQEAA